MRLIDADDLFARMENYTDLCAEIEIDGLKALKKYLDMQSTAYDIDKVVEELETDSSVKIYGSGNSDNYLIPVHKAIEIVKHGGVGTETETIRDKAVKWNNNSSKRVPYEFIDYVQGKREICVSDDVCEWKFEETNGIAWHCDDKCTTYNQVYIQDLKITLEDFECKCPYCGKKIKIVGD